MVRKGDFKVLEHGGDPCQCMSMVARSKGMSIFVMWLRCGGGSRSWELGG